MHSRIKNKPIGIAFQRSTVLGTRIELNPQRIRPQLAYCVIYKYASTKWIGLEIIFDYNTDGTIWNNSKYNITYSYKKGSTVLRSSCFDTIF